MKKIVIIGACGSGKTTLGHQLSQKLQIKATDMDELYWLPGWKRRPFQEFVDLVKQATSKEKWIICGNYSKLQHLTLGDADTIIWLDLPFFTLLWRIIKRSIEQAINRSTICNGNRQSFAQFLWLFNHLFKSYWKKKKRYRRLKEVFTEAQWIHLENSSQVQHLRKSNQEET